jgi:hypothetical protein
MTVTVSSKLSSHLLYRYESEIVNEIVETILFKLPPRVSRVSEGLVGIEYCLEEVMKSLDPQLSRACTGGMVQMPPVNSQDFYFPQVRVDFTTLPRIPALVPYRVGAVSFLADPETDEVFAKIIFVPVGNTKVGFDDDGVLGANEFENPEKPDWFAKTLTESDIYTYWTLTESYIYAYCENHILLFVNLKSFVHCFRCRRIGHPRKMVVKSFGNAIVV